MKLVSAGAGRVVREAAAAVTARDPSPSKALALALARCVVPVTYGTGPLPGDGLPIHLEPIRH